MRTFMKMAILLSFVAGISACPDKTDGPAAANLSDIEEELVGLWSRYRSSNARTEYYLFKTDRSACYWEETSANYDKLNMKRFSGWDANEANPVGSGRYIVDLPGSGLNQALTFDWVDHRLWLTAADNVIYFPDNDERSC